MAQHLQWDSLWLNVHLATMPSEESYGECRDGAIAVKEGMIVWLRAAINFARQLLRHSCV